MENKHATPKKFSMAETHVEHKEKHTTTTAADAAVLFGREPRHT